MSRTKGHGFEREIAKRLRSVFPEAKRKLEYQIDECQGIDLDKTGKLDIQCKRLAKYVSINTIKEVQAKPGRIPALVTKADREPAMIVLPFDEFLRIIEDIGYLYEKRPEGL